MHKTHMDSFLSKKKAKAFADGVQVVLDKLTQSSLAYVTIEYSESREPNSDWMYCVDIVHNEPLVLIPVSQWLEDPENSTPIPENPRRIK